MALYPGYKIADIQERGRKITVTLAASTLCGEDIDAKSTVTAKNLSKEAITAATNEARAVALRNLGHEHDSVVKACKRRGTHNH